MKYEIIQTKPYPMAEFEIKSRAGNIGKAVKIHKTKKWTDWAFEIEFCGNDCQMVFGEEEHLFMTLLKMRPWTPPENNPYRLYVNGIEAGKIYMHWGRDWMEINGRKYSTCTIGFGSAGLKCLVFEGWFDRRGNPGGKQIALIETPNLGKLLDQYEVSAEGDIAGLVALFFGLYWDTNSFHKSDTYYEKVYLETWGKEKQLYDPTFKNQIMD